MEWTDIRITVPKARAEEAEAIATGMSGGGIYIEDYSDLETQVEAIAHVDLIEQDLLDALVIPKQPDRRIGFDIDQQAYRLFGKAHADNMYNRFDQRRQHIFRLYQFELARFNF